MSRPLYVVCVALGAMWSSGVDAQANTQIVGTVRSDSGVITVRASSLGVVLLDVEHGRRPTFQAISPASLEPWLRSTQRIASPSANARLANGSLTGPSITGVMFPAGMVQLTRTRNGGRARMVLTVASAPHDTTRVQLTTALFEELSAALRRGIAATRALTASHDPSLALEPDSAAPACAAEARRLVFRVSGMRIQPQGPVDADIHTLVASSLKRFRDSTALPHALGMSAWLSIWPWDNRPVVHVTGSTSIPTADGRILGALQRAAWGATEVFVPDWATIKSHVVPLHVTVVVGCPAPVTEYEHEEAVLRQGTEPYTEQQVDLPALLEPASFKPRHPPSLLASRFEGEVLAYLVVDTTGRVEPETFRVYKSSHELFSEAVREALPQLRFSPAYRDGKKVRQTVGHTFQFFLRK